MPELTDKLLKNIKLTAAKKLTDDKTTGLKFYVTGEGRGKWILQYTSPVTGKRPEMGLGTYPEVSLADARKRAGELRLVIDSGKDPVIEKKDARQVARVIASRPTFGEAATALFEEKKRSLKNGMGEPGLKKNRNVDAWISNVRRYFAPILNRRVDTLTKFDFEACLLPQWFKFPKASDYARRRAAEIMDKCKARDYVTANVVADVRGLMPKHSTEAKTIEHHPSMAWQDLPQFIAGHLTGIEPTDIVRACAFVQIMTACRPMEACGMRWSELDLDRAEWSIGKARMKATRDHLVPLQADVVALLRAMQAVALDEVFVFPNSTDTGHIDQWPLWKFHKDIGAPSRTKGRHATTHGFRATLMDWTIDHEFSESTADRQLAHKPKGQVKQAYERTDQFRARRRLMTRYADYLMGRWASPVLAEDADNVIPLYGRA